MLLLLELKARFAELAQAWSARAKKSQSCLVPRVTRQVDALTCSRKTGIGRGVVAIITRGTRPSIIRDALTLRLRCADHHRVVPRLFDVLPRSKLSQKIASCCGPRSRSGSSALKPLHYAPLAQVRR
jgi:hypothetical protein